jgi:hypothetical protein
MAQNPQQQQQTDMFSSNSEARLLQPAPNMELLRLRRDILRQKLVANDRQMKLLIAQLGGLSDDRHDLCLNKIHRLESDTASNRAELARLEERLGFVLLVFFLVRSLCTHVFSSQCCC